MTDKKLIPYYLLLLSAVLYLSGLGARDFWAPVEPRYAEIARVMFTNNEWVVPTVNGTLYTDKPILYFWLVLVFSKLAGGVNEWTVRLPAALGGIGAVFAVYRLGKDFFNVNIGLIAAAVFATSVRVIWEARWAHLDMTFTCLFTFAMLCAARVLLRHTQRGELMCFYGLLALATLTKGLIGVVLSALILGAYVIITRNWRLIREARLPLGTAIFLAVAAPWFAVVNQATGGAWLEEFVYLHHIQRYTDGFGHREPWYYYFTTLPVDFLPWTLFAVPALTIYRPSRTLLCRPVPLFFTVWFAVIFLFFSASDSKRDLYLLPLLPPVSLLTAVYLDDLLSGRSAQRSWERILNLFFTGSIVIACIALPVATGLLRPDAFWAGLYSSVLIGIAASVSTYFVWRRLLRPFFWSLAATMVIAVFAASLWILPYLDRYKSPRPLALAVNRAVPPGVPLYIYADTMHDFNFYSARPVIPVIPRRKGDPDLADRVRNGFLLIRDRDFERLSARIGGSVVLQETVGGDTWYLIATAHTVSGRFARRP